MSPMILQHQVKAGVAKAAEDERLAINLSNKNSLIITLVNSSANTAEKIYTLVPGHVPPPLDTESEREIAELPPVTDYLDPAAPGTLRINQIALCAHKVFGVPLNSAQSALEDNERIRSLRLIYAAELQRRFDEREAEKTRVHQTMLVEKMQKLLPYAPRVTKMLEASPYLADESRLPTKAPAGVHVVPVDGRMASSISQRLTPTRRGQY